MVRPPDYGPDLIRDLLNQGLSAPQIAAELGERLGKVVPASSVRSVISRHRETWELGPANRGRPYMDYQHREALGRIDPAHQDSMILKLLATYERVENGITEDTTDATHWAMTWTASRRRNGEVVDYNPEDGPHVRPAWPWEFGQLWRLPVPERAVEIVEDWLSPDPPEGGPVTPAHLEFWATHLSELDSS